MQQYYLLGGNVSGSPSPLMMNSAFKAIGIDASYAALSLERSDFRERFLSLKRETAGMNVTIPFKSEVIPLLDELDPISRKIGAVNVTKASAERCLGFNTDVSGIVLPLKGQVGTSGVRHALLVGAGGAARAFCEAMSQMGCPKITVAVRDREKGKSFVEETSVIFPEIQFEAEAIDSLSSIRAGLIEVIFNATPIGSRGIPLPEGIKRVIYGTEIVFDAVYRPMETELLKFAKEKGCRIIHGYEMLLNQGTAAFEIWTGKQAPVATMKQALMSSLGVAA
jgi:shikimate dehydrogenase